MAEESEVKVRTGFEQFQVEFARFWNLLPLKGLFGMVLLSWVALFVFLGNSTLGYTNTSSIFSWLDWIVKQTDDDQHIPWVLAGILALLWWKREEILRTPKQSSWLSLAVLGAAILLHALGYMVQQTRISLMGFYLGIYGIVGVIWGVRMMRVTFFPMFLFAFCLPMGGTLANSMTLPLRIVATKITTTLCQALLGIHVIQDGTRLFDANQTYTYEVAAACSGIRSLTATLALALVYGFVMFKSTWRRIAMVLSTIPLAIAANVFRLMTIVIASEAFGQSAGKYCHESSWVSLIPYIPMIGGILVIGWWLREKRADEMSSRGEAANWTNRELGGAFGVIAGLFLARELFPAVKTWTHDHQYSSASGLVIAALLALILICKRKDNAEDARPVVNTRNHWSLITTGTAVVFIAATAVGLNYRQSHQKLGTPGVKVVQIPIYDPDGKLAGTNSVALPERVLSYESKALPVDRIVLDWLPKDTTYAQRLYKANDGFESQMSVVLMGSDRTSIHQPQYCLTGTGWHIDETETESIPVNQPRVYQLPVNKLTVSRVVKDKTGAQQTVRGIYVYWFVADNRLTAHHGQRMLDMGLDMLRTGVLQRWAYVSCFSMCHPGKEKETYARLKELISAAVPEFQLTTGEAPTLARNP